MGRGNFSRIAAAAPRTHQTAQRQLASWVGVSRGTVQDWEAGLNYPDARHLQALIAVFLQAGGLTPGAEASEAEALWDAALRQAPRTQTRFDAAWWAGFLALQAESSAHPNPGQKELVAAQASARSGSERRLDWAEAPDAFGFVGRVEELAMLREWILEKHCRLVALLGMGGIGKTMLGARLVQEVATAFERVYWRSMHDALPIGEWLAGAIGFLSDQRVVPPQGQTARLGSLLELLLDRPCLLVLDNFETLLEPADREGRYRDGYADYGRVLHAIGERRHQSCLVVTSREAPRELAVFGGDTVCSLQLGGLDVADGQVLIADKQLTGNATDWANLVDRFGGNGLALRVVGESVRQVFGGDIHAFLEESGAGRVFGGIRRLLGEQIERGSPLEQRVLRVLAVAREPISASRWASVTGSRASRGALLEAIEALRRRSLLDRTDITGHPAFTLQSMVLEYVTGKLVETAADEIDRGQPVLLVEQPLIKAQAKDYVRQTQERLIGAPILRRLTAHYAKAGSESRLLALLDRWRGWPAAEQGYGPGNVVNLLRILRGDLRGMDLSRLSLIQVYLQGVGAQDASLTSAHLAGAVLDEPFAYPTAIALSADGSFLVAGTPAGDVRVWRTADRTLMLALQGHTGMVWGVAVSGDGRLVASGGDDGLVRLWEAGSGQPLATMQAHTGPVWGVALSADGRLAASGGEDGLVRLWETGSGHLLASLQGHTGGVRAVALSGDVRLVASGGDDLSLRIWEVETGHLVATLQGHTGVVYGLALSGDGGLLVSGSVDGTVRLWKPASGQLVATLEAHPGGLRGVALSADGRLAASGGGDGLVRLWDVEAEHLLANMLGHTGAVWCMALSADGQLVASGSQDGTIRLWEAGSGQLLAVVQGHTGVILSVALLDDGRLVASGGVDGMVRLWGSETEQLLVTLQGHTGLVRGVALSADGRLTASAGDDGIVRLWEPESGQLLAELEGHTGTVWCMALSANGRRIASGGLDNTLRLWDSGAKQLTTTLHGHTSLVWGVALSADGRLAASASLDGTVRLWDAERGQLLGILQGHAAVWGVTLSGDGQLVACGCVDGTVRLWETRSSQLRATLHGHSGLVYTVALSGDGRLLASGGADGVVQLWETTSGQLLATLRRHTGVVWSVALSWDGGLLVSGGDDGMLRLWDTGSGACRRTLRADRRYERLDITGLTGVTEARRAALLALGAREQMPALT